jgi:hypothetical protein
MLLVQRGWREGWRGVILSGLYACYVFSKYAKLWELRATSRGKTAEEQGSRGAEEQGGRGAGERGDGEGAGE